MSKVVPAKTYRSVCIVGFAEATRGLANSEPKEVEIWGLNLAHQFLTRWDRWFQIHPKDWQGREAGPTGYFGRDPEHLKFLQSCGVPVYTREVMPEIPTSIAYPFDDVVKSQGARYFTSSVSYMLALALHEKVDEIKLYGINLSATMEYHYQRACVEFWLGKALGQGVKVTLPNNCPLLHAPLYAREEDALQNMAISRLRMWKLKYMEAWGEWYAAVGAWQESLDASRKNFLRQVIEAKLTDINGCIGAIKAEQGWLATFAGVDVLAPELPPVKMPPPLKELVPEPLPATA